MPLSFVSFKNEVHVRVMISSTNESSILLFEKLE